MHMWRQRGEGLIGILGQNPKCSYAQSVCTKVPFGTLGQKLTLQLATVKLFSSITSSQFRSLGGRSLTKFATMMFYNLTPT